MVSRSYTGPMTYTTFVTDLTKKRYGKLRVLRRSGRPDREGRSRWWVRCDPCVGQGNEPVPHAKERGR